jgi:rRNA-processing protein FCF1
MKKDKFKPFTIADSTFDLKKVEFNEILKTKNPIVFDTNFLFITFQFKIDIIVEIQKLVGSTYSLFIYEGTIGELESVERKKEKNKQFLPLIVRMLHIYGFKIIKSKENYIDDQIMSNLNKDVLIATNDKELRLKIQKKGFRVYI